MTDLFKVEPKQELTTYAVARAAADPVVVQELSRVTQLLSQVPRVEVQDEASYGKAGDLLKLLKNSRKKLDEFRKELTGPVDRAIKAVNKYFKDAAFTEIDGAEAEVKAKMAEWFRKEEARRREEARIARERAEEQALALAASLAEQGQEAAADALVEQGIQTAAAEEKAGEMSATRGEHGSTTSARSVWKWREIDKTQVPNEYLVVDRILVNEAVRKGVREIPGIEIYEDIQVAIR